MQKIITFTDIHMQPDVEEGKLNPDLQLQKGFAHVNEFNCDADLVIICGDLAHKGDVRSYEMLRSRLEDLNTPWKLMMGNHDNRENFLSVFPETELDESGFVQQVIKLPSSRLIILDTLNAPPYDYPFSHQGFLCEDRLSWLGRQLDDAGEEPFVIFMHHPPHSTGFVAMDLIRLNNGEAFYELIKQYGNVKHIICGHVHRTISGSYEGIPFSVFKSTVGQMPMLFDVMDFKMETNEPAAYGMVCVHEKGVLVQTEDYELTDLSKLKAGL